MLAMMTSGAPVAQVHQGQIALFANGDGEPHGFLMSPECAVTVATRLLAVTAELSGDQLPVVDATACAIDHKVSHDGEDFARLVFDVNGAPVAVALDMTQFAEFAAAVSALSRALDKPRGSPRKGI